MAVKLFGRDAGAQWVVDLRSDTVTRPTAEMLQAMAASPVGDDVWGDDPTVNQLQATLTFQETAAAMFGMEAGLFCPSGTMTNQIAIKVHTQPGDELICADTAHIYLYEGGGIAFNSGVQAKCLPSDRGRISAEQIKSVINSNDPHFPCTRLVCVENTCNKGGGSIYPLQQLQEISRVCSDHGLRCHLDGARIFNALVEEPGYTAKDLGHMFDSISVCLSKGLGCPVGSVLLGSQEFIRRAARIRKVLGGGMRQAGFLAGAGLYALKHNVDRLKQDHAHAKRLAETLSKCSYVSHVAPVETNIVIFYLVDSCMPSDVVQELKNFKVLAAPMGDRCIRLVTHLDVSPSDVDYVCGVLCGLKFEQLG